MSVCEENLRLENEQLTQKVSFLTKENNEFVRLLRVLFKAIDDMDTGKENLALSDLHELLKGGGWAHVPEPLIKTAVEGLERANWENTLLKKRLAEVEAERDRLKDLVNYLGEQ